MSIHFHIHIFNAILGYCDNTLRSARYIIIIKKKLLKCVYTSLKNRFSAIKSTLKVELCFFMSQHKRQSANAAHIRPCNSREVESFAIPKWFQIIYQMRSSMAANFTSQAAAIQARYMLNKEECFRQRVWRPEIWYWTERMATCDISESGSIDLMFREKAQKH